MDNVESRQSSPSSSVVRRDGLSLSKDDEHKEENKRRRLSEVRISEVVDAKHSYRWVDPVISHNATVREAIVSTIEGGLSGMMVLGDDSHVVGLLTSRDLLRIIASGIVEGESNDEVLHKVIKDHMTPISQVIYARPEETIGMCRTIMAKLGIKCLPILAKDGRVAGVITAKDISTFGLTAKERGGKESYLNDVSQRVGLSINTRYGLSSEILSDRGQRGPLQTVSLALSNSVELSPNVSHTPPSTRIIQHGRPSAVHEVTTVNRANSSLREHWEGHVASSVQNK